MPKPDKMHWVVCLKSTREEVSLVTKQCILGLLGHSVIVQLLILYTDIPHLYLVLRMQLFAVLKG